MLFMMLNNKGVAFTPYLITKVVDSKSRILYESSLPLEEEWLPKSRIS